jgi:hypothetical protein
VSSASVTNRRKDVIVRLLSILITALAVLVSVGSTAEPTLKREDIEWTNIWVPNLQKSDLPRVLLVGDSITNSYYDTVANLVKGKAYVARLATSSSLGDPALLDQVKFMLANYKFAVIHFNNGMHGFDYTDAEYQNDIPKLLRIIRKYAPGAKLIWATTTPVRKKGHLQEFDAENKIPLARNKIVASVAAKEGIPLNDLYAMVEKNPEYSGDDGIHFKPEGTVLLGKQVATMVLGVLGK